MRLAFCALLTAALLTAVALAAQPYPATIVKIDPDAGKVTLEHGAIEKIDMGAMTMSYRVADKALLSGLASGDHVTFDIDGADGVYTVTKIEKAR